MSWQLTFISAHAFLSEAIQSLQAEVSRLKDRLEDSLRHPNPTSHIRSPPSASEEAGQPHSIYNGNRYKSASRRRKWMELLPIVLLTSNRDCCVRWHGRIWICVIYRLLFALSIRHCFLFDYLSHYLSLSLSHPIEGERSLRVERECGKRRYRKGGGTLPGPPLERDQPLSHSGGLNWTSVSGASPSIYRSACVSICLSVYLSFCLPVCVSVFLPVYRSACLYLSFCLCICLPVCVSCCFCVSSCLALLCLLVFLLIHLWHIAHLHTPV